jgi:lipopolysaccharide assembly outer membrane protein LptD (OstA)
VTSRARIFRRAAVRQAGVDDTPPLTVPRLRLCAAVLAAAVLPSFLGPGIPFVQRAGAAPAQAAAPGRGAAATLPAVPVLQGPLNVTADELVADDNGVQLIARGHVRLTYAAGIATANMLRLRQADRIAEFSGNVILTDPRGKAAADDITVLFTAANQIGRITMSGAASTETKDYSLQGDHIVADRAAGRLAADGHITMFTAPDLIVNGDHATYEQAAHYGRVSGHVVASNRLGRILGDWIEFFQQKQQAAVHGAVTAEVYGATITGGLAQIDFPKSTAVFTDHVTVTRRQGTLNADRVTILYKTRRLIAQGATHVHFTELEDDTTNP